MNIVETRAADDLSMEAVSSSEETYAPRVIIGQARRGFRITKETHVRPTVVARINGLLHCMLQDSIKALLSLSIERQVGSLGVPARVRCCWRIVLPYC